MAGTVLAALGLRPPAPRPLDAPPGLFSAGRAAAILASLSPAGEPHPVGSGAGRRVRERIEGELRRLGYRPEVQAAFGCGRFGFCADVENVVARREAVSPGKAVLVMAHYDGVPAGPGVSDDLVGVAVLLEVARALAAGAPAPRPVIFLFTDGEEEGIIGATAFASEHRWSREIGAAINVDTRGVSGPSLVYETVGDDGWLVRRLAADLPRPVASSVFVTVYRALPADSDLSAVAAIGVPGLNFGYIGRPAAYHTARDDLAHLDLSSLQHHGDNALAMVRSLLAADLDRPAPGRAVFFDVFGRWLLWWPEWASGPLAALAALLWLAGVARRRRRGELAAPAAARGLAAFLAAPLAAGLLAFALHRVVAAAGAGDQVWVAHPLPFRVAAWSAGLLAAVAAGSLAGRRAGAVGLGAGIGGGWCLAALALSALLPGASYLAILPALAYGLAGPTGALRREATAARPGILVPALAGAIVLLPFSLLLEDGAGLVAAPGVGGLVALAALPLAPAVAVSSRPARRWVGVLAGATAAAGAAATALPASSPEDPEHLVLMLRQDADTGLARWLAYSESGRLPEAMRRAAPFGSRRVKPLGWGAAFPSFEAEAAPLLAPGPELTILERSSSGGVRWSRLRVASPRGGREVYLVFPPEARVEEVLIRGKRAGPPPAWLTRLFGGFQTYRCLTLPPEGVEVQVGLAGEDSVGVELIDATPGLPPSGAGLAVARPPWASTFQEGDATYFTRIARL